MPKNCAQHASPPQPGPNILDRERKNRPHPHPTDTAPTTRPPTETPVNQHETGILDRHHHTLNHRNYERQNPAGKSHIGPPQLSCFPTRMAPTNSCPTKNFSWYNTCMASFSGYQQRGIYPWAHADIVPAIHEISRAAGVPGINAYCYQANGVGAHRTGRAADFQAGTRAKYVHSARVHDAIARYVLQNDVWKRLRVRYVAWNGWEYINRPSNSRRQTKNYGGTDPFHKNHVHVDFLPGPIPGARPNIAIGGGTTPPPSTSSKNYYTATIDGKPGYYTYVAMQRFLKDRGYYTGVVDGEAKELTWTAYQKFLGFLGYYGGTPLGYQDKTSARATQRWLTASGHFKGTVNAVWDSKTWRALQTYLTYAHSGTKVYKATSPTNPAPKPTPPPEQQKPPPKAPKPVKKGLFMALTDKQQEQVHKQVMNVSAATSRSEAREREMLLTLQQQNDVLLAILNAVSK